MKKTHFSSSDSDTVVEMNNKKGYILIKGRLISINPSEIWSKINTWYDSYRLNPCNETTIELNLDYINTGNVIELMSLMRRFDKMISKNYKVMVKWHVDNEDEDMKELGEDLKSLSRIPFVFN